MLEETGVGMHGRTTRRARSALLPALCAVLAILAAPAAGSQSAAVLWQGRTPDDGTAFVAGLGRELRIELEAAGSIGSSVRITMDRRPPGATLVSTGDAPAKAVFGWRPRANQLGEWKFVFTATDGSAYAPRLVFRVHVGRRAARTFRLSSRAGLSRNAALLRGVAAYARPNEDSRVLARLKALTPEHVPHVLYLANGRIDGAGRYWLRVPLPLLPNGTMGWIPRDSVGDFATVDTHLVIERSKFRVTLYKRGRPVFRSIVGVGEPRWPTPAGSFYVRERLTGFTDPIYGHLAFGTNGRSAVLTDWPGGGFIGVHGTNQPEILPGRVSHGCVRLPNHQIRRLDRLMRIGTPVTIK
ncbi:MAG TPA: L,D-transpeptidase [Gaiellaceae bacterium]